MKNKNYLKKIIMLLVIASLSVTCFGCNKNPDSNSNNNNSEEDMPQETLSLEDAKWDLTFIHDVDSEADSTESKEDAKENDATTDTSNTDNNSSDSAKSSTAVTPDKPVAVTEHVEVTDNAGQPVTDSAGTVQTEVVTVTEQVKVTDNAGQPVTDSAGTVQTEVVNVTEPPATEKATQPTEAVAYTPSYDICKSYWLDMSENGDFFFEGEFLIIEFEVNENIPDGNYPVRIKSTDIASWDLVKWEPVCIDGEVAVNSNITSQQNAGDDFTLKVDSVSAKQGEKATVAIDLSNNPGFCGFVLEIEYDKSAMKIVSTSAGADFDGAVNYLN